MICSRKLLKNILLASILVFMLAPIHYTFFSPTTAEAIGVPYGGRSRSVRYCTCTPGCFKVYVGGPKSAGWKMYCTWSTIPYEYYNIFPSAWQLGTFGSWIPCLQIAYPSCTVDGGGFLMMMNGTSMY